MREFENRSSWNKQEKGKLGRIRTPPRSLLDSAFILVGVSLMETTRDRALPPAQKTKPRLFRRSRTTRSTGAAMPRANSRIDRWIDRSSGWSIDRLEHCVVDRARLFSQRKKPLAEITRERTHVVCLPGAVATQKCARPDPTGFLGRLSSQSTRRPRPTF